MDERASVTTLMMSTCGCKKGANSQPCSSQFPFEHVLEVRASCSELTRSELDMVVMGQLMAGMNSDPTTKPGSRHTVKDQWRASSSFYHQGKPVCERMFRFIHTIGETRFKNLKKSLRSFRLAMRSHGNLKHSPAHALSLSSTEFVVRFVLNYTEAEYRGIANLTSSYSPRQFLSVEYGRCTRKRPHRMIPSMLLPTPHSPVFGAHSCHQSSS